MKTNTHSPHRRAIHWLCIIFLTLLGSSSTQAQIITTYAGTGVGGYSGDGGPATAAQIGTPLGLTIDPAGNILYADYDYAVIRKIDKTTGIINTIAGNGTWGDSGDGGPATSAEIGLFATFTDASGNTYLSNQPDRYLRKISPSGIITRFAGTGTFGYSGDGGPALSADIDDSYGSMGYDAAGSIYFPQPNARRVRKITTSGIISTVAGNGSLSGFSGDGGPALAAGFSNIDAVAVDASGNLYISDGYRIRKVNISGIITTIAGTGTGGYSGDGGPAISAQLGGVFNIFVDATGDVYFADQDNSVIRKIDVAGNISTVVGTGVFGYNGDNIPATTAQLYSARGVVVDSCKNIYIADYGNARIRKVTYAPPITGPKSVCVGNTITLSDAATGGTWSSGAVSVATIGVTTGIVNGIAAGTAIITYATHCFTTYDTISVVNTASITGPTSVCDGSTISLTGLPATGTWSSSATGIATVGSTGIVSGVAAGSAIIILTSSCGTVNYPVTVNPAPSITGPATVCAGNTITLSDPVTAGTWSTASTTVASVGSSSGVVTAGIAGGVAIITCTASSGCTAVYSVTVGAGPIISGPSVVCIGGQITLSTTISGGTWIGGSSIVADINAAGVVTGYGIGGTTFFYTTTCGTDNVIISVGPSPVISAAPSVCAGNIVTMSCAPGGGTWSSNNPVVATITPTTANTADLYGASPGTTTISYTVSGGCTASVVASVFDLSPVFGPTTVCTGASVTLSTLSAGGNWSSSDPTVATVTPGGGVVTGVGVGVASIIYTNACGSVNLFVNVDVTPTITGTPSACVNPSTTGGAAPPVTLTANPPGGAWSSSDPTVATISGTGDITAVASGTATISYTSPGGCMATITATMTARPDACVFSRLIAGSTLPEFYFTGTPGATVYYYIQNDAHLIVGYGSLVLTAAPVIVSVISLPKANPVRLCIDSVELNGCFWSGCSCAAGALYCCASIDPLGFKQGNVTGIQQPVAAAAQVTIIPNPSQGTLTVKGTLQSAAGHATIEVTDVLGKVVYSAPATLSDGQLDATITLGAAIPNGMYLLKVKTDDISEVARFALDR